MIKAVFDTIVVEPNETTEQFHGNIIVPDMGKEKPHTGVVIDVGPGKNNMMGVFVPTTIQIGDTVILPKIGPVQIEHENKKYYITPEINVLAIIKQ